MRPDVRGELHTLPTDRDTQAHSENHSPSQNEISNAAGQPQGQLILAQKLGVQDHGGNKNINRNGDMEPYLRGNCDDKSTSQAMYNSTGNSLTSGIVGIRFSEAKSVVPVQSPSRQPPVGLSNSNPGHIPAAVVRNVHRHYVPPNNHSPRLPSFVQPSTAAGGLQQHHSNNGEFPSLPYDQSHFNNAQQYGHKHSAVNPVQPQTSQTMSSLNVLGLDSSSLPPFSSPAVSAATQTAIANIVSLIENTSTSMDNLTTADKSQPTSHQSSNSFNPTHLMYERHVAAMSNGVANTGQSCIAPSHSNSNDSQYHGTNKGRSHGNYSQDQRLQHGAMTDRVLILQRELEQERTLRLQLQSRVMQLSQKVQAQQLVEESYEALSQKYKLLYSQMQQMSMVIERYKTLLKQVEQDKILLYKENASHKAQEDAANDKTILYNILLERSKKIEEENSSLVLENEMYQRQYEKCIDEISKQVVQALLTQKALQEQCLQLQDRLSELERENSEYYEAAVRQARQASSDSRLGWSYRSGKARTHAASPSADSVRSMPAQHLYWRQNSASSLEQQQQQVVETATADKVAESPWTENHHALGEGGTPQPPNPSSTANATQPAVSIETEFPANNGSPKSTRRSLDRHPSSGSLDSAYHSRAFVKYTGKDARCQRSASAEALRDMKVKMRPKHDLTLPSMSKSNTSPAMSATVHPLTSTTQSQSAVVQAEIHTDLSTGYNAAPTTSTITSTMTDSGVVNDPFADDADDILSKHQSLIVGSTEDLFSVSGPNIRDCVIQEEESGGSTGALSSQGRHSVPAPTPPPRPRSTCLSESSLYTDNVACEPVVETEGGPPPLPPKQYKGSRRKYKPLPAEPTETDGDSSDRNTDSDSIKQEINALTSQIVRMTTSNHQ